ncbi:MAG: beta strand repeat-containing protein [Candidatus Binataceae bacterium]
MPAKVGTIFDMRGKMSPIYTAIRSLFGRGEVFLAFLIVLVFVTAGCGGSSSSSSTPPTPGPNNLKSITVTPDSPSIASGTKVQLTATGELRNGTFVDVTSAVNWQSSDSSTISVSTATGTKGEATAETAGSATITASLAGVSGSTTVTGTSATVVAIAVTSVNPKIPVGTSEQLTATGVFSDGTSEDLTISVTWASSSTSVASVTSGGLVTGNGPGNATISATLNELSGETAKAAQSGISGETTLIVTPATLASIAITPNNPTIANSTSVRLIATGTFSDGSTMDLTSVATWTSTSSSVAKVADTSPSKGEVTGVSSGTSTVHATFNGISDSTTVTVTGATLTSIVVTPPGPSIPKGTTVQLTAIGMLSDGSSQDLTGSAAWTSSSSTVATVIKGLVFGADAGSSTITASFEGIKGSTPVSVNDATLDSIIVAPANPSIAQDLTLQMTATGVYSDGSTANLTSAVSWASSAINIAEVSNTSGSQGLLTTLSQGSATISASFNGIVGSTGVTVTATTLVSINVTPADPTIANGTTVQLTATGTFSNGATADLTGSVTWASSDNTIATVTGGLVTGKGVGSASISATQSGISGSTTVTVSAVTLTAIMITPVSPTIAKGTTAQLTATGQFSDGSTQDITTSVTWASSEPSVATVSNASGSQGLVTGVAAGTTTISATSGGIMDSTPVTVTSATLDAIEVFPHTLTIANGVKEQLSAIGTFSDGTTLNLTSAVTWVTSNPTFVTVSNSEGTQGQVTGHSPGSATVTASLGTLSDSAQVTVDSAALNSITVTPVDPTVAKGIAAQFTATGNYSDGTIEDLTQSVTWASSVTSIATISNAQGSDGLADTIGVGTTSISATMPQSPQISGSTVLAVTSATLTEITVGPSLSLAVGTTGQLTATGTFSDGTTLDLTSSVSWTTSESGIAVVSNATGTQGLVLGVSAGNATITAFLKGISGTTPVTVTSAVLNSITITPVNPSVAIGTTQQLTATGVYSDGSTADLTNLASWTSSNTAIATVDSTGLLTGIAEGTATISAQFDGITGTTDATVTTVVLVAIDVSPSDASIAPLSVLRLTATGVFADGSTQDLTQFANWTSDKPPVAWVSNAARRRGRVTGLIPGTANVFANFKGLSGSASITVSILSSIVITPTNPSIGVNQTQQLTATGTFTGSGDTVDLTNVVSWQSSDPSIAIVGNFFFDGRLKGQAIGSATISASLGPVSGSTLATVTPAVLTSITVEPENAKIAVGSAVQMVATGNYSDGSKQDLTQLATWISSNQSIAQVSNAPTSQGQVSGIAAGSATISAIYGGLSNGTTVTVTAPRLVSITVTPANPSLRRNSSLQMTATATYSDGSTEDLTDFADWTSSDSRVASFNYCHGQNGLLFGKDTGTATVRAEYRGVSGTTRATVTR